LGGRRIKTGRERPTKKCAPSPSRATEQSNAEWEFKKETKQSSARFNTGKLRESLIIPNMAFSVVHGATKKKRARRVDVQDRPEPNGIGPKSSGIKQQTKSVLKQPSGPHQGVVGEKKTIAAATLNRWSFKRRTHIPDEHVMERSETISADLVMEDPKRFLMTSLRPCKRKNQSEKNGEKKGPSDELVLSTRGGNR